MGDKKKTLSGIVIVIWFILFWPIGMYLLIKKLTNDKSAAMKSSRAVFGVGIFFIIGAFVMLIETLSGDTNTGSGIFGCLFYLIGGILLIYISKRMKESGRRYKRLIDIVINQQQHVIENIAMEVGLGYDATVKELQKMIDKEYFKDAYINQTTHEITFSKTMATLEMQEEASVHNQKIVICPSCGGNNIINVGQICECEYCGSHIQ